MTLNNREVEVIETEMTRTGFITVTEAVYIDDESELDDDEKAVLESAYQAKLVRDHNEEVQDWAAENMFFTARS